MSICLVCRITEVKESSSINPCAKVCSICCDDCQSCPIENKVEGIAKLPIKIFG